MNHGEPSDDLSKIGGRSSVVVTLSLFHGLIHVPNAHTGKLTPGFGCSEKSFLSRLLRGVRTHLRGLQVTVTRMAGKLTVLDAHQAGIIIPVLGGGTPRSPHLLPSISHIEKSQTHTRLPVPMKEKGLLALITHPPETPREDEPLFFLCLWIRFRRKKQFFIQDKYSYPKRIQCT
ncbi:sugar phosphate phosphate translocator [Olea europaea subsp. europaea]|uniref:Sugar phosphate phosphate translocator n=1 Tax=Olea europaea subsp. europaea TaxID=158383 RepID=A0A8S0PL68_OLEEU|nr:sugar phosphate phosphate translocator [Olea europaea subsp. europaea]